MNKNYQQALAAVLKHEGGYVNHPRDPGGATNFGVTQAVYDAYRKSHNRKTQSVKYIASGEVEIIYRTQYWDAVRGDDLPDGLDYAVFDYAVNSGPSRAIKHLQIVVGVAADGKLGLVTLTAIKRMPVKRIIEELCTIRMRFLRGLPTWDVFGRGWSSRVEGVKAKALKWASEAPTAPSGVSATTLPPTPTKPATEAPKGPVGLFATLMSLIRSIFRR
jgi:lysozyme family protein